MYGNNKTICIAGKNSCAIEALKFVIKNCKNYKIIALPNKSDNGNDTWQKSFKNLQKKNIKIINLNYLYKLKIFIYFLWNMKIFLILKNLIVKIFTIYISVFFLIIEDATQIFIKLEMV